VAGSNRDEKGSFQTSISQDLIDEALKSVERHTHAPVQEEGVPEAGSTMEVDIPEGGLTLDLDIPEGGFEEPGAEPSADPGVVEASLDESRRELEETRQQLEQARRELEETRQQLEFSQSKGREMMERLKDSHERALRAAADLENYKKRAQKEKEEVQKFGSEKLLKDLLPVIDNLDRAMDAAAKTPDFASFHKGVAMTRKSFEDTLARHGVKAFSAKGQPFDPRLHEAVQQVETAEVPAGHVAFEVVRGFHLNDRLVRPAMVVVARAPAAVPEQPSGGSQ
jgi:molecular chaperone GrpE